MGGDITIMAEPTNGLNITTWAALAGAITGGISLLWHVIIYFREKRENLEVVAWYLYNKKTEVGEQEVIRGSITDEGLIEYKKEDLMRTGVDFAIINQGVPTVLRDVSLIINRRKQDGFPLRSIDGEIIRLGTGGIFEDDFSRWRLCCSPKLLNSTNAKIKVNIRTTNDKTFSTKVLEDKPHYIIRS